MKGLFEVEANVPDGWTEHDLTDVVLFHLDLSDLSELEVDISACDITHARLNQPNRANIRAAISNAFYDARNNGRTMEHAADDAANRVMTILEGP